MTDDELHDWVRDELFWDPKVDSAAIAVSANDGEVTYEHGEGYSPGAGVKASPGQREPGPAAERGDVVSIPPDRPLRGSCRTAIPARWSLLEPS
jgi:hypothetical protein